MYIYTYVCIYVFIYVFLCLLGLYNAVKTIIYIYVHTHICIYIYTYHVYKYTCYVCTMYMCINLYTYIQIHIYVYTYIHLTFYGIMFYDISTLLHIVLNYASLSSIFQLSSPTGFKYSKMVVLGSRNQSRYGTWDLYSASIFGYLDPLGQGSFRWGVQKRAGYGRAPKGLQGHRHKHPKLHKGARSSTKVPALHLQYWFHETLTGLGC